MFKSVIEGGTMNELVLVSKQSIKTVVNLVRQLQGEYIAVNEKSSQSELTNAYKGVFKLIGTVDTLRSMDLLEDETYQTLVEENVRIEEKIRFLKGNKRAQRSGNSR